MLLLESSQLKAGQRVTVKRQSLSKKKSHEVQKRSTIVNERQGRRVKSYRKRLRVFTAVKTADKNSQSSNCLRQFERLEPEAELERNAVIDSVCLYIFV